MLELTDERIAELKGKGFLLMKDKEPFNVSLVLPAGFMEAVKMARI